VPPRTAIVIGGTGGLGAAVVARLVEDGLSVAVLDARTPDAEHRLGDVSYEQLDVLDEAALAVALSSHSPWAVVNVVGGYAPPQALEELELSALNKQLELNLLTAATITKCALGAMKGGGRIVHTSSRAALDRGGGSFSYSVSKLAVIRLVEAAAAEGMAQGVTVNCILPSIIDTPANRASMPKADYDRWPKPHQLAAVISFLCSDDAELVSGAAIPVYGRA